ncbi:molybdopterin-dependent oxidoreductase [Sinorhizobium meliloti]|nr:molybdopterin cofactor-binding domain-containing protein [Sinorhizobium meliloti]MDW9393057.1 molybdopterin-dependent oxidoreductase [Sinorhizobium meliloti]MDW9429765.1 molybdopterin-dependent oxidoreductase [Sinorhizobium meliloti]MDW9436943.1 molybdopterin-dependent oxidoreductase [Sinorhizobium meliloti]MDW9478547.1 molybdopterin-dependent oxidoreductase [Sinorhizobium meliloti]MDW9592780.1 molybdopterin-dependent oxidoreductase [Sinorhizobium meliloti]
MPSKSGRRRRARLKGFAAEGIGTTPDKVKVNTTLLGGGFGRKAEADFIVGAVSLAKVVEGRPVKVIWSREDDTRHDKLRPLEAQHIQVGLDADGKIVGWRHHVEADSIFARTMPELFKEQHGHDDVVTEGARFNYSVPAHRIEYLRQDNGLAIGFWFAVGVGYTRFGIECMIDEVAAATGADPVQLRLELLQDQPRARKVIETVAQIAEWNRQRDGRALGSPIPTHSAHIAPKLPRSVSTGNWARSVCTRSGARWIRESRHIEAMIIVGITNVTSQALFEQVNIVDEEAQEANFDPG